MRAVPVRLRGTITYRTAHGFFLQDATAGIFIQPPADAIPGDQVDIVGVTAAGDITPVVLQMSVRVIRSGAWPSPKQLIQGTVGPARAHAEWMEAGGIVQAIGNASSGETQLLLNEEGRQTRAIVAGLAAEEAEKYVDAEVRVAGVVSATVNRRGQFTELHLLVPGKDKISVDAPAPSHPYEAPVQPLDALARFAATGSLKHRVRVQGVVTLQRPGASLFIQQDGHGLYLHTATREKLQPGDLVDVLGFPSPGDYTPILIHSTVRRIGRGVVKPRITTAEEARSGLFDAELVSIDGTVQDRKTAEGEDYIVLKSGYGIFDAYLRPPDSGRRLLAIPVGTLVRVTGVCSVKVDQNRRPRLYRIAMRSPADLQVIQQPPRFTAQQAISAAGVTTLAGMTAGVWVLLLRRRVRQQTEKIEEKSEELERQLIELDTLYHTAPVGLCLVDSNLRFVRINERLAIITGVPAEAHTGKLVSEIFPHMADLLVGMYRQVLDTGDPMTGVEVRGITAADPGMSRTWLMSHFPVKTGSTVRVHTVVQDITSIKDSEAHLVKQAQDLARSNADLQQFAWITSHDLQEPLRMMRSFSQMVASRYRGKLDDNADLYLGFISEGAQRMQMLVDDLLSYSRVSQMEHASPQTVELTHVMCWSMANLRLVIDESRATVLYDRLPSVRGDKVQLVQLFQNLISNGIKYRSAAPPVIRITAERKNDEWTISVQDNGIGIKPEYHEQVFGIFKRLSRRTPGTGIGLAICRKIVERHGGRIWVESNVNEGSAFRLTLPAATGPLTLATQKRAVAEPEV